MGLMISVEAGGNIAELACGIYDDGAKLLEGTRVSVPQGGWSKRIRLSLVTLGIRPLFWDPVRKLLDKKYLSLWEETSMRSRNVMSEISGKSTILVIHSPGRDLSRRPLIAMRVGYDEFWHDPIKLVPEKSRVVVSRLKRCDDRRGGPYLVDDGVPTVAELSTYRTLLTATMDSLK